MSARPRRLPSGTKSRETLEAAVRSYTLFAARVADGDLTATVEPAGDEDLQALAGSLNKMVAGLAEISGEIQVGVQEIGASTTQILASANEHSDRASQQSAAISRTTAPSTACAPRPTRWRNEPRTSPGGRATRSR